MAYTENSFRSDREQSTHTAFTYESHLWRSGEKKMAFSLPQNVHNDKVMGGSYSDAILLNEMLGSVTLQCHIPSLGGQAEKLNMLHKLSFHVMMLKTGKCNGGSSQLECVLTEHCHVQQTRCLVPTIFWLLTQFLLFRLEPWPAIMCEISSQLTRHLRTGYFHWTSTAHENMARNSKHFSIQNDIAVPLE